MFSLFLERSERKSTLQNVTHYVELHHKMCFEIIRKILMLQKTIVQVLRIKIITITATTTLNCTICITLSQK